LKSALIAVKALLVVLVNGSIIMWILVVVNYLPAVSFWTEVALVASVAMWVVTPCMEGQVKPKNYLLRIKVMLSIIGRFHQNHGDWRTKFWHWISLLR